MLVDAIVKIERALSNIIQSTSISCGKCSQTTLYSPQLNVACPLLLSLSLSPSLAEVVSLCSTLKCSKHIYATAVLARFIRVRNCESQDNSFSEVRFLVQSWVGFINFIYRSGSFSYCSGTFSICKMQLNFYKNEPDLCSTFISHRLFRFDQIGQWQPLI